MLCDNVITDKVTKITTYNYSKKIRSVPSHKVRISLVEQEAVQSARIFLILHTTVYEDSRIL
jgi:hypothetical protein